MAVPARRTSKAKKNKRRTHYKVTAPSVTFDETTGDYSRSHRVSLKGRNTHQNFANTLCLQRLNN